MMMPRVTVYSLQAALTWFVVGISLGAAMMIDTALGYSLIGTRLLHSHIHIMLFAWLVQCVFAIAFWMLPRFGRERPRAQIAVAALVALNLAGLAALGLPWTQIHSVVWALETGAFCLFAVHAWPRIKAFGV